MNVGRTVFGAGVLASGLVTLVWHDGPMFVYVAAVAQIAGGAAIVFRRSAKPGGFIVAAVYLILALLCVPRIIHTPQIYDAWGNFFEPFSLALGGWIVYACFSSAWAQEAVRRIGRILFGICVISFTLEQAFYLDNTATLVPKWLPPSQMFWSVMTTIAFALGAVALLVNQRALLAARLLKIMIVVFGLAVWVPLLVSHPNSHTNWSEFAETFAIAGVAWMLADLLGSGVQKKDALGHGNN
jgi:uncharacterized membrane protein